MSNISLRITGIEAVRKRFKKLGSRMSVIDHRPFARMMEQTARDNLEATRLGWPNERNPKHITFSTRTRKLAKGTAVILFADAIGKDGYNYASIQEYGLPVPRFAKGYAALLTTGRIRSKKALFRPMRFFTPEGRMVSAYMVGPIPAKGFMEKTADFAAEAYPVYIEKMVAEAIDAR